MRSKIRFILNNRPLQSDLPPGMVVLDFLRREMKLTGTREGCREGDCGACTVLMGDLGPQGLRYRAVNSCLLPLGELQGRHLVTIEGVSGETLNPIQQRFVEEGATQCGFCTPGFIMSLTGFFLGGRELSCAEALEAVDGNICRCTGYSSIQRAIEKLVRDFSARVERNGSRIHSLVELGILPEYFLEIEERLEELRGARMREASTGAAERDSKVPVAGGTDLFVQRPEELAGRELEFLLRREELAGIRVEGGRCTIGALVTVEELKRSPEIQKLFPRLDAFLKLVSSTQIRNRATVGGNIVNASPIGDLTIFFLALDPVLILKQGKRRREVALKDFYKGYKELDLAEGELVEAVRFQAPGGRDRFNFEKVSKRERLDIASVNSAAFIRAEDGVIRSAGLSAGGVAPVPLYLRRASEYLQGREIEADRVKEAAGIADGEVSPISDVRGSAAYKRLLLRQLLFAHFIELFPERIEPAELIGERQERRP